MTNNGKRDFDIVVWGATGFTGRLVAQYLLGQYGVGNDLRWAIAGRNESRLTELRDSLGDSADKLPSAVADSFDAEKLDQLTKRTKVVITTVGPFAKYGSALVAACARNGTDYCDLAGEPQWIRRMIDDHQEAARQSGARIVHCCGFDSVPSDLGVSFLQHEAIGRTGMPCQSIRLLVKAMRGGPSGGTLASMLNLIEESGKDREVARILAHPYGLNPRDAMEGPDRRDQRGARYDEAARTWTAPFVMAAINTRVVRRTHALLGFCWGRDFRYSESVITGTGVKGRLAASAMSGGLGLFVLNASFAPTRTLMQRFFLTKPGSGPDLKARENGFFNLQLFGVQANGDVLKARVTGDRDPGYGSTSKMLAEAAVCLSGGESEVAGGMWTPASALAKPYLARLRENSGLTFEMID